MRKLNYEQKALFLGVVINLYSAIVGFVFFYISKSTSLFLDGMISAILCLSTIISIFISYFIHKEDSKKYPLGSYAIENMFLLFRALLMLATIVFTIVDGGITISNFINGETIKQVNTDALILILYMGLMTSSCFAITIIYSYFLKKLKQNNEDSKIVSLEIKASIYDGLVTVFAVSSLLIFSNVSFLESIKPIGDAITVIILSVVYLVTPIKEIIRQIKVLTDKRRDQDKEKELMNKLKKEFKEFNYYDLYYSYSGDICSIYVCLMPKSDMNVDTINKKFNYISSYLYEEIPSSKVFLILTDKMLHMI